MAKCFECDLPASHNHHVVPTSLGGTKTVPLCNHCHPKAHGLNGYWPTSELIKAKLQERKANGYRIGGKIPYGKTVDTNKRIIDNPQEQYWQYVAKYLHDQGIHFKAIARMFNARHVPTKYNKQWRGWIINKMVKRLRTELGEQHKAGVWARGRRVKK